MHGLTEYAQVSLAETDLHNCTVLAESFQSAKVRSAEALECDVERLFVP